MFRDFTSQDAIAAASAALSRAWSAPVTIDAAHRLGGEARRNLILRARAGADGMAARPIVVKATRAASYDMHSADAYTASGFVKEWAAARYLARHVVGQTFTAALLAHDLNHGVLVYQDLGDAMPSLVEPLLHGTARQAEQALTGYAEALAALHRATIGCRSGHAAVLREGFPSATIPPPAHRWIEDVARVAHGLLPQGLPGGAFPDDEMEIVAQRLRQPGCWQALVHGDPCPDNVLLSPEGRALLIDLEFARPGHALLDAAYWRMGFPTCWCAGTIPIDVARRIQRTYRASIAEAVPAAADDDAFMRESAIVDVAWLLGNLAWLLPGALAEDGSWGRATNRSRILTYLQSTVQSLAEADILPRLRALALIWQDDLRSRWPDAAPLSDFPAFVPGAGQTPGLTSVRACP